MARWFGAICAVALASGGARAGAISANMAVSVTVLDQCLIHSLSRSASCSGGAVYAVGVSREAVTPVESDRLTASDEHVHTSANGARVSTISPMFAVAGSRLETASASLGQRSVEQQAAPVETLRVTYSF